jgi:hypothetical protein
MTEAHRYRPAPWCCSSTLGTVTTYSDDEQRRRDREEIEDAVRKSIIAMPEALAQALTEDLTALGLRTYYIDRPEDESEPPEHGAGFRLEPHELGIEVSWQVDRATLALKGAAPVDGCDDPTEDAQVLLTEPMVSTIALLLTRLGYPIRMELGLFGSPTVVVQGLLHPDRRETTAPR